MKKYPILLVALCAAVLTQADSVPTGSVPTQPPRLQSAVDPRDQEIKALKNDVEQSRKVIDGLNEKIAKLTAQRNQLAAGLLDLQQSVQDALDRLDQVSKERDQLTKPTKVEDKK